MALKTGRRICLIMNSSRPWRHPACVVAAAAVCSEAAGGQRKASKLKSDMVIMDSASKDSNTGCPVILGHDPVAFDNNDNVMGYR